MRLPDSPASRPALSLTPLIDVVFLLLVFFMLASTFLSFASVPIRTAGAGATTPKLNPEAVVLIHVGPEGWLRVNGAAVAFGDLETHLKNRTRASVEGRVDGATTRPAEPAGEHAIIALRDGATVADLVPVLGQVRRVTFKSIRVAD